MKKNKEASVLIHPPPGTSKLLGMRQRDLEEASHKRTKKKRLGKRKRISGSVADHDTSAVTRPGGTPPPVLQRATFAYKPVLRGATLACSSFLRGATLAWRNILRGAIPASIEVLRGATLAADGYDASADLLFFLCAL